MIFKDYINIKPNLNIPFRNDINVLRAISVIVVILFHFDFYYFKGGFVGVDIFFVISGYVITVSILKQIDNNNFNLKLFYLKRVWRLFPALICVFFLTTILSFLIFSPLYLVDFAKSLISSIFSISNFFFWNSSGYFETAGNFKPLLHTWSLAVEEQFYLIWPLILIIFFKVIKKSFLFFLVFFSISFSLVYFSLDGKLFFFNFDANSTVFYLLPFRIFEFTIGALLIYVRPIKNGFFSEILALISIIFIFCSVYFLSGNLVNPNIYTLIPLLGVFLFLITEKTKIHILLENKVILFIGTISYSLYLVHWPIFVFLNYYNPIHIPLLYKFFSIVIIFLFSILLFNYVENKYRHFYKINKNRKKYLIIPLFLLLIGFLGIISDGLKLRISPDSQNIYEYALKYKSAIIKNVPNNNKILLLGESHSTHFINLLRNYFQEKDFEIVHYSTSGCIPLPDTFILNDKNNFRFENRQKNCLKFTNFDKLFNLIKAYDAVILSARWSLYLEDNLDTKEANSAIFYLSDEDSLKKNIINVLNSKEIFKKKLNLLIEKLNAINIPVLIMGQVPPLGYDLIDCLTRPILSKYECKPYFSKFQVENRLSFSNGIFNELEIKYKNVKFINSFELLCKTNNDYCPIKWNNIYLYRDDDHLNMKASQEILPLYKSELDQFLKLIKQRKNIE